MIESKLRIILVCPKCCRLSKDFVPLPDKNSIAVQWCRFCKIVLCRFDYGTKIYEEKHPEDNSK